LYVIGINVMRQITPPTKNSHAPPLIKSRTINLSNPSHVQSW
jgi:hypothetical protein